MKYKIAFIGLGNMGGAILSGLLRADEYKKNDIIIYDKNPEKLTAHEGIDKAESAAQAVSDSKFVLLCVKPQCLAALIDEIKPAVTKDNVFVSIVAGVTTDYICAMLNGAAVVRVMPNTPMLVGCGISSVCRNGVVSDADFATAEKFFACGGITVRLPENKMNEIIALTGSSPAYTLLYIKSLEDGAREQKVGLNDEELKEIACKSVIGAAKLYMESDKTADELIRAVTSPGGTTEKAMDVLNEANYEDLIIKAMQACTDRAYELSAMLKKR